MILADVGNRHIHIYEDGRVIDLDLEDAIESFGNRIISYISVSQKYSEIIRKETYWKDISRKIELEGSYEGMGIDRKALCLSRGDALYIDAGSAITVDKVKEGKYCGGFIFPGFYAYKRALREISPALDLEMDYDFERDIMPKGSSKQIAYGMLSPLLREIEKQKEELPVYISGGDGNILSSFIKDAKYSPLLVFEGILNSIKK